MNSEKEYVVNYPVAFHTVDIAVIKDNQVLLIQKPKEIKSGKWRFPGGFVDVKDLSAESAAERETKEETGMSVYAPEYITSCKIPDPRFKDSPHKIITSFYALTWREGKDGIGFDDVAKTKWFDIDKLQKNKKIFNPIHVELFENFFDYIELKSVLVEYEDALKKRHAELDVLLKKYKDKNEKLDKLINKHKSK